MDLTSESHIPFPIMEVIFQANPQNNNNNNNKKKPNQKIPRFYSAVAKCQG